MSWDPFQREVLAELGHVLYRTTTAAAEADRADPPIADLPAPDPAPANATTADVANPDAAMLARLARAAGVPSEVLPAALREPAALARLRGDGAAKRALWPRLRALRARLQ